MSSHYNPFKENRAEQMRDLWKYYIPIPGIDGGGIPLVIEGGRGTGKTMFFQCNSWREIIKQIKREGQPGSMLYKNHQFIGIYYRSDTAFVASMIGRDNNNWPAVFETYFSICILQEVLDLLCALRSDTQLSNPNLVKFVHRFAQRLNPSSQSETLEDLRSETDRFLDRIEDMINGADGLTDLRLVGAHRFITDLCTSFNSIIDSTVIFKIFVDEYETLQDYQQKCINTLIKHSTIPVIFNIGLRPEGMKTNQTNSMTQTIESPHDYEKKSLSIDQKNYLDILRKICKKRIALGKEIGRIDINASEDIEDYLGLYNVDSEIEQLTSTNNQPPFLKELRQLIISEGKKQELPTALIDECVLQLCDNAPIINSRLHYALLYKKTSYTPLVKELYDEYVNKSRRYADWMHNRKFGIVFMLAKDYKKSKMYYGFNVYAALSSGIVRYFLELCERAFSLAFLDDYNWGDSLSPEIQSEAAKYVSEYKIMDIAGYEPYGKELRIFVQFLGQIFYRLHTDQAGTIGEPEPNHFSTKDLALSDHIRSLLASAIMWNVLQVGEPTKRKQSVLSPETIDYYLNKIYVPYFGISYRNQRKIQLEIDIISDLISGDVEKAKRAISRYFKSSRAELSDDEASDNFQMTLFERL